MSVRSYPLPSIYRTSDDFAVIVDGQDVSVTEFAPSGEVEYHYAHFSFSGLVTIQITTRRRITACTVSPLAFEIPVEVSDNTLTLTLERSRYLIVKIDELRELVIAADPEESDVPDAHGPGIFNVATDFGADPTGVAMATAAIQAAVDAAHAARGGVVYVPAGVFTIGSLVLRSQVRLYLAGDRCFGQRVIRGTMR